MSDADAPELPPPPGAADGDDTRILILSGRDHPGVLDEVAAFAADRRCRMLAVRTAATGGHFSMVVRIAGEPAAIARLQRELDTLAGRAQVIARLETDFGDGCELDNLYVLRAFAGSAADAADVSTTIRHAGNLMRVVRANLQSIRTLHADDEPFEVEFRAVLPDDVPAGKFRELLGQMFDDLGVGWQLTAAVDA